MLVALIAAAAVALTPSGETSTPIVVTGQSVEHAKRRLADCLANRCPTDKDIDATLALAEAQLIAGKYRDARTTLLASLKRNQDQAMRYPIPVSDLYRANAKVAASLGFDNDYYNSTWGIYRTLKYGLPSAVDRRYSAMMEVAEMMYRTRGHERAQQYYDEISREASADGRPDIAALAQLRMVIRHYPEFTKEREIRRILASTDPSLRAPALEGKLALARMAYAANDDAKGDAIVKELESLRIEKPILIYSPKYELEMKADQAFTLKSAAPGTNGHVSANPLGTRRTPIRTDDMWIDVEFRITRQGRVQDLRISRSRGDRSWAGPLLASIRARRYTPAAPDAPEALRRERYTYTSPLEIATASHLMAHSPNARVEYLDLSELPGPL